MSWGVRGITKKLRFSFIISFNYTVLFILHWNSIFTVERSFSEIFGPIACIIGMVVSSCMHKLWSIDDKKKHMVKFNPCSITLRLLTSIGFSKLNFFGWFWWVSQHFTSLHWTRRWFSFIVLKMTLLSLENEYT